MRSIGDKTEELIVQARIMQDGDKSTPRPEVLGAPNTPDGDTWKARAIMR